MSEARRYHNLAGVVRDLEHARGEYSTAEGRDLLDRWRDIVADDVHIAEEIASALDADDESEDEEVPYHRRGNEVGDALQLGGHTDDGRPGGDAQSGDALLARLAGLESALAALQGPPRGIPGGGPSVDGAGRQPTMMVTLRGKKSGEDTKPNGSKKRASKKTAR